ncbi:DUF4907 domain-containing protein [Clostridium sporogenes]|uniref:DUF4907 domain-containing protein n=1 Tax=Clostridium sporogenes TaxID=1509 RepID=UPI0013D83335|nr:DUF4907 domain-containing protein [Clostridium sporogenes]NFQ84189.1 DUF4907 domain-containing protein [Clostridium sporogenes]
MYSYKLIDGGYEILKNDLIIIKQDFSPNRGTNVKLNKVESENIAKFTVKKLELGKDPCLSLDNELILIQGLTDEGMNQLLSKPDASSRIDSMSVELESVKKAMAEMMNLIAIQGIAPTK